jgi:predicted nucleotidyltransferase component of viral defense system
VIADKFVDLYARNAGLRDKLVAERDVVLTYALAALVDDGVMSELAFKGGTCLRKIVFGSSGRFSEDLDFTLTSDQPEDDVLVHLIEAFNRAYFGIRFRFDEYYKTQDDNSFGGDVFYSHAWNNSGHFRLQVSLRERPTLPIIAQTLQPQSYFTQLEFEPPQLRALAAIEMIAEKVRAAFQRAKVRDVYDLYRFASAPFDGETMRRLVVLKLWQVRDPFNAETFFTRLRDGRYEWEDLHRLLRSSEHLDPEDVLRSVESRFSVLHYLTELERELITDAKSGWNEPLAERLRSEIKVRFADADLPTR